MLTKCLRNIKVSNLLLNSYIKDNGASNAFVYTKCENHSFLLRRK